MKFLCIECDHVMRFAERQLPGDGTLAAVFTCERCEREIAMLTNPMETQFVSSMGIQIGGREVPEQPMELTRTSLDGGRDAAFDEPNEDPSSVDRTVDESATADLTAGDLPAADAAAPSRIRVEWTPEALERLERVPRFVRGMVKRIYTDYAQEKRIARITPDEMDRARSDLGLEGM